MYRRLDLLIGVSSFVPYIYSLRVALALSTRLQVDTVIGRIRKYSNAASQISATIF